MRKIVAAFCLLALAAMALLVKPAGVIAKPNRSDLEERVVRLEVESSINRQNVQDLDRRVRALESSAENGAAGEDVTNLQNSVRWIRQVYIPQSEADIDKLDKRVKDLEREHLLEYLCAKPTAKQRADRNQMALAKQRAAMCLELGGKRD